MMEERHDEPVTMTMNFKDPVNLFKADYPVCLLIFSVLYIMGMIGVSETKLSGDDSPALVYLAIWGGCLWLNMVEHGHASLVVLDPVNRELY